MTAMTDVTVAAGQWTSAYTAAGNVTVKVQNKSKADAIRVRAGASVATSDGLDAAHMVLMPGKIESFTLVASDKILLTPHRSTGITNASPAFATLFA